MSEKTPIKSLNGHALVDTQAREDIEALKAGGGTGSGEPGFSPVANVQQTADGATITIKDSNGTTAATVKHGKAATVQVGNVTTLSAGTPAWVTNVGTENAAVLNFGIPQGASGTGGTGGGTGADGFSPIANVQQTETGATITIKDKNGTTTANIKNGEDGKAATVKVGNVLMMTPDSDLTITNTGTENAAVLNFSIPRGADGKAATVQAGRVYMMSAGSPATVKNEGTENAAVFDFYLPKGADGYNPSAKVEPTTGGATITITDKTGTTTATVNDGISPEVTVSKTGKVTAFMVVDKNGPTVTMINDGADGKDYTFDPTVYGLPVLYLTGDISPIRVSKDNKVTLTYVYGERSGTCTLKGQGATSYKNAQKLGEKGKYNYTITFDNAFEAHESWGAQKKYCLKANTIDHTHSRNDVSAKLWGMIVKSRTNANVNLSGLVNGGAVDGFPIVIMVNDDFHGLYTFNIPKDGWMMGMVEDTTKQQAIFGANDHETATQFKGLLAGDESDFEMEFVSDEDNADWATASLNRMIQACMDSWGGDLDDVVGQYLDWDSVIDYYIWTVVCKGTDMVDKNYLLSTFDGVKWHFTAYDMDSTYGLNWDGSGLTRAVSNVNFEECAATHRAYELIKRFKTDALKSRYNALRANVLSETRIMQTFENFAWAIPSPVLMEDVKKYPAAVYGSSVNTIDQIGRWVRQRLETVDAWIAALPAQETPSEPEEPSEGYTNLVPTSTDTDGSIYNGTGYKDNARLSSTGGVSGTAQSGSVTTGFIPYTVPQTIRIKGAVWNNDDTSKHYYVNFYDSSKTYLGGMTASSYAGGNTPGASVTYDAASGVTTFDFSGANGSWWTKVASAAYIRLNAKGKGADLIVTVNQEITD